MYELFAPDEIDEIRAVRQLGGPDRDEPEMLLYVTAHGETSTHYLWRIGQAPGGTEELRDHVASELQDFISESKFGWGQQRLRRPGGY